MRILYHFPHSPFSRRVRLALAHKGLAVELRDGRAHPALLEEARRRSPLKTVPVLIEEDGRAIGDSTSITHYLDRAYPSAPALWPTAPGDAHALFEVASLVDVALNEIVALGTRYHPLHEAPGWEVLKREGMERAQRALDALGDRVSASSRATIASTGWSAADMWLFTMQVWLDTLPARARTFATAAQIVSLGWTVPDAIKRWADKHQDRDDVRALA